MLRICMSGQPDILPDIPDISKKPDVRQTGQTGHHPFRDVRMSGAASRVRCPVSGLALSALLLFAFPALAAPPPGTDLTSLTHQWFEAQHSVAGAWCCNISDGHLLDDTDWRQTSDHYEVRIGSQWYPIPDTAMRDPRGGPNPTGKAIVWYINGGEAGLRIFCFAPGWEG